MHVETPTTAKPPKPYPSFPLSAHANGQWYTTKRIHGRKQFFYFGEWADDGDGRRAHAAYLAVAADIHAGRQPQPPPEAATVTAGDIVGRYMEWQEARARRGEIGFREFDDVRRACLFDFLDAVGEEAEMRSKFSGASRPLDSLRSSLASRLAVVTFNKRLSKVRGMLRWAHRTRLLLSPLHEDDALRAMAKKLVRKDRRQRQEANGAAIFTPQECRRLVDAAAHRPAPLLAFVLLGLNGGIGQSHISDLPSDPQIVDTGSGFIDWVRTKTEEQFQVPLWPITSIAMETAAASRPKAVADAAGLFFVTRFGNRWVRETVVDDGTSIGDINPNDEIGKAFDKLQRQLQIKRPGRGFYGLRRTFATAANDVQDRDATRRIMGHGLEGMDPHYVREISRDRLWAVVNHVGFKLLGCVANS